MKYADAAEWKTAYQALQASAPVAGVEVEKVGVEVWKTYKEKRRDYFARAQPIIKYHNGKLSFEFDYVNGFLPNKAIMSDLLNVLGFDGHNNAAISAYGTKITFPGGAMVSRGPGMEYSATLKGGAKPLTEQEMIKFVKNCAFQHYLSHKPDPKAGGPRIVVDVGSVEFSSFK